VELLKLLSANELVAQTVAFLLLLAAMRAFFWKRILALLDERKARIAAEFKSLADERSQAEAIRRDYEGRLETIDQLAKSRVQDAINDGRRIADEIRENASKDGEKMIENARAAIKEDLVKAREELKDDVVDLVISAASKVIQEKLSVQQDRKLVEFFINQTEKKQ
jgi:F-type H+-transporting ATPase subunit b